MVFNDYKIPEEVTAEEEFAYNLIDKMYAIGSGTGFVLGAFSGLIEKLEEEHVSHEVIKATNDVMKLVESHFASYETGVYQMAVENWNRLGKPLSMAAHIAKKKQLDAEDAYKAEYCDR